MKLKEVMTELSALKNELYVWNHLTNYLLRFVGSEVTSSSETMRVDGGYAVPKENIQLVIDKIQTKTVALLEERLKQIDDMEVAGAKAQVKRTSAKSSGDEGKKESDQERNDQGEEEGFQEDEGDQQLDNGATGRRKGHGISLRRQSEHSKAGQ